MADVSTARTVDAQDMHAYRTRLLILFAIVGLLLTSEPSAHAATQIESATSGRWTSIVPVAITRYRPSETSPFIGTFRGVGSTSWRGALVGVTAYTIGGHIDLRTNAGSGWIHERFAGRSSAGEVGTITFDERYTLDAGGHISINAAVVSGTGDFARLTGALRFDGTTVSAAYAGGTYAGRFGRSA